MPWVLPPSFFVEKATSFAATSVNLRRISPVIRSLPFVIVSCPSPTENSRVILSVLSPPCKCISSLPVPPDINAVSSLA